MNLLSRNDFPRMLNERGLLGTAVEIGTNRGEYAEHFRREWNGRLLLCVDPWEEGGYAGETKEQRRTARIECYDRLHAIKRDTGACSLLPMTSIDAANYYRSDAKALEEVGGFFDFIYIDGDHSYEGVRADLEAWWPLVKPGGIIAGHDWIPDGWRHYGDAASVVRAQTKDGLTEPGWPCFVERAVRDFFYSIPAPFSDGIRVTSTETDGGWQSWWVTRT